MRLTALALILTFTLALPALAEDGQIDIAQLPYTITQPGSYVVVDNLSLTTPDTDGITITCDNVTIDLAGHTLTGPGNAAGAFGSGIVATGENNIAVSNGMVTNFRSHGLSLGGYNSRVCQITAFSNGQTGISIGENGTVFDNVAQYNGNHGIRVGLGAVLRNNSASQNGGDGLVVSPGATAIGNASFGNVSNGIEAVSALIAQNACLSNTAGNLNLSGGCVSVDNYAP